MKTIELYGASDDLIEVEGDITEEFNAYAESEPARLAVSDGTVLEVRYGDTGLWKITRIAKGSAQYSVLFEATDPASRDYSDRVQLRGDIQWIALTAANGLARGSV